MSMETVTNNIADITDRQIMQSAAKWQFYNHDRKEWQQIGWMGWVRALFSVLTIGFIAGPRKTCLRYSWASIAQCDEVPQKIAQRIEDLFLDSLTRNSLRFPCADLIGRVLCKTHAAPARQIDVQQHPTIRAFTVFEGQQPCYQVVNSSYGQLNFYRGEDNKLFNNDRDAVWNIKEGKRIRAIEWAPYFQPLYALQITDGRDQPKMMMQAVNREFFVFRRAITNELLAVASFFRTGKAINWRITPIIKEAPDKEDFLLSFSLGVLKYSQHYHFEGPDRWPYTAKVPKEQEFRS